MADGRAVDRRVIPGLLLLVALGACGEREPTSLPPDDSAAARPAEDDLDLPPFDPSLPPVEAGRSLYQQLECAGCHESAAVPGLVVVPLIQLGARFDPTTLAAFLSAPPPPMPNFGLPEPERRALAAYLLDRFD